MEQEVKRYFLYGDDLKIYTKHGGKFVFHLTNDSFELKAVQGVLINGKSYSM